MARPGALPATGYLAVYADRSFAFWPALLGFILLLTPAGRLDLDTLTAELLAVVGQTMQPARASLWLRAR